MQDRFRRIGQSWRKSADAAMRYLQQGKSARVSIDSTHIIESRHAARLDEPPVAKRHNPRKAEPEESASEPQRNSAAESTGGGQPSHKTCHGVSAAT